MTFFFSIYIVVRHSEIVHIEDWCDEIVAVFALQAMVAAVGVENMQMWFDAESAALMERGEEDGGSAQELNAGEEDADAMEIAGGCEDQSTPAVLPASAPSRSLYHAYTLYNTPEWMHFAFPEVAVAGREAYTKRAVQLLSQLCLVDVPLLGAFGDLYSAWAATTAAPAPSSVSDESSTAAVETAVEAADTGAEAVPEPSAGSSEEKTTDAADSSATVVAPAGMLSVSVSNLLSISHV